MPKMHPNEFPLNEPLVRQLLATQFSHWANLPIVAASSAGTDNAIFRLGKDMAVRLPRIASAAPPIAKEFEWLPRLASQLPLAIPTPLAKGKPGASYPWPWYIFRWLDGDNAVTSPIINFPQAATDLGNFIAAMQHIDTTDAPASRRGNPLAERDEDTRKAIAALQGDIDTKLATKAWEEALAAPVWHKPPVWIHGDLHAGNVLTQDGNLSAVIDFGTSGTGDPACDLMAAWTLLSAETRDMFRKIVQADDATWARGRGWALSFGLIALPYYKESNLELAGIARRGIGEVLGESSKIV